MKEGKFRSTLNETLPPEGLSMPLEALWWQHQGNWERAHALVQSCSNKDAAWVHALLHREEGDLSNANYWYKRTNRCLLYTSPSPRDQLTSRMPSSA